MTSTFSIKTNTPPDRQISIVGSGRLGAPIAACLDATGFQVIAVDRNLEVVEQLNAGRPPIYETNLDPMLQQARPQLRATTDTATAVQATDTTFVLVPTPSERDGSFSLRYVTAACEQIGGGLAKKDGFHLVVLVSTVMPGATGGPVRQALEQSSGKRCGEDFGLCYSPEFVALGSVIHDYLNPDFILIGESDPRSGDLLAAIYDRLCVTNPPVVRMNFTNAELTKIALNSFITTKITFANSLVGICQHLPEADVDQVTSALGLDSRIGNKYLKGGVGYGGPCFPRDNQALASLARSMSVSADLAQCVDHVNRQQVARVARLVKQHVNPGDVIGILGLAYKPNSDVIEQSQGVMLARTLADDAFAVVVHDPVAANHARNELGHTVRHAERLHDCIEAADAVVVMTPWPAYRDLSTEIDFCQNKPKAVIDPWRFLADQTFDRGICYVAGGIGPPAAQTNEAKTLTGAI